MLRGDLTCFRDSLAGSHEFQTGIFAAPRSTYDQDNGVRERRLHPRRAARARSEQRRGRHGALPSPLPVAGQSADARRRGHNIGLYAQDTWRPPPAPDHQWRRPLRLRQAARQPVQHRSEDSWHVGPRIGFSYMLTGDAKNIVRGSYVRLHEQMMGRDAVTIFGAGGTALQRDSSTSTATVPSRPSASPLRETPASRRTSSIRTCISRTSTNSSSACASSSPGSGARMLRS